LSQEQLDNTPEALARRLGHDFDEPQLLIEALTHRSAGSRHNERLEFLGDSVLNCVIAAALYAQCPEVPEGDLTRLRASLVRERTLAQIAGEIALDRSLRLGANERRSGVYRRASTLSDTLEAVIGAVYLDAGFETAREMVLRLYVQRLATLPDADSLKDAKTRLQEWLQAQGRPLPCYETVDMIGAEHARHFVVRCELADDEAVVEGEGSGRRRAEQEAARAMLTLLRERHGDD
jgi:ribonuclease-3